MGSSAIVDMLVVVVLKIPDPRRGLKRDVERISVRDVELIKVDNMVCFEGRGGVEG